MTHKTDQMINPLATVAMVSWHPLQYWNQFKNFTADTVSSEIMCTAHLYQGFISNNSIWTKFHSIVQVDPFPRQLSHYPYLHLWRLTIGGKDTRLSPKCEDILLYLMTSVVTYCKMQPSPTSPSCNQRNLIETVTLTNLERAMESSDFGDLILHHFASIKDYYEGLMAAAACKYYQIVLSPETECFFRDWSKWSLRSLVKMMQGLTGALLKTCIA